MDITLLGNISKNIAVLGVAAYLTTQLTPFRHALNQSQYQLKDMKILLKTWLTLFIVKSRRMPLRLLI